jgi:hypothetical protein
VICLPSKDGDIFAVEADPEFELLSENSLGELLMSTLRSPTA